MSLQMRTTGVCGSVNGGLKWQAEPFWPSQGNAETAVGQDDFVFDAEMEYFAYMLYLTGIYYTEGTKRLIDESALGF